MRFTYNTTVAYPIRVADMSTKKRYRITPITITSWDNIPKVVDTIQFCDRRIAQLYYGDTCISNCWHDFTGMQVTGSCIHVSARKYMKALEVISEEYIR